MLSNEIIDIKRSSHNLFKDWGTFLFFMATYILDLFLCSNYLKTSKRRRDKNYFHKEAEGEYSLKPMPTDTNKVQNVF